MPTSWIAAVTLFSPLAGPTAVSAQSALVVDAVSGKPLWSRNADEIRYPASTTKIMTGLLLLENTRPDDIIVAPPDIDKVGESSMNLKPGERVTARDMLYAIMLRSANDGCVAIAHHISGSVPKFAALMNERARQLGARNTQFNNPNGLNDNLHVTTAEDLALIAREAMRYPEFREVVRTKKYEITRSINQKDRMMINRNKWLAKDATADGIKTGYTRPAGLCYVGSATRNGFRVITSILKSENWQVDHKAMLDWSYRHYRVLEKWTPGEVVGKIAVEGGSVAEVPVFVGTHGHVVGREGSSPAERRIEPFPDLKAPIVAKQRLGEMVVVDADGYEQRVPVYAKEPVDRQTPLGGILNGGTLVMGTTFVGAYFWLRRRLRRPRTYARHRSLGLR